MDPTGRQRENAHRSGPVAHAQAPGHVGNQGCPRGLSCMEGPSPPLYSEEPKTEQSHTTLSVTPPPEFATLSSS